MAKTKTHRKNGNKSDVIRAILKKNPNASVKQVQATLRKRRVKASDALVNKIKYGRGRNGTASKSPNRAKRRSSVNKAEAIRGAWREMGLDARPRDVVARLASRGLTVTSAQVSTLRKSVRANQASAVNSAAGVPYEHLVEAKELATRLGGVENAQAALAGLARLISG